MPEFYSVCQLSDKTILVDKIGKVTSIGINRPEKRNCLDVATAQLLSKTLEEFENNEETSAAVLYGVGGNFCAGYDLKEIANYDGENEEGLAQFGPLVRVGRRVQSTRLETAK